MVSGYLMVGGSFVWVFILLFFSEYSVSLCYEFPFTIHTQVKKIYKN